MVTGIALVLVVSYSIALLVNFPIQGREILSRGNPNLIDLAVAMASGAAGAIAVSRSKIASALPGVAIAVALVPPLCAAGISFAMGDSAIRDPNFSNLDRVETVEWGALLLFFTNLAAILVVGALVFFVQGYGKFRPTGLLFFAPVLAITFLAFPLTRKSGQFSDRGRTATVLLELAERFPHWDDYRLSRMRVEETEDGETLIVRLRIEAPAGALRAADGEAIGEALSKHFGRDVRVEMYVSEYHLLETTEEAPEEQEAGR